MLEHGFGSTDPKYFAFLERQFKSSTLEMAVQDVKVVRVDEAGFDRSIEEIVGMIDDVLIEGAGPGDHDGDGGVLATAGATESLPGAGDRAGISAQEDGFQLADIDAQLQSVGGDDPSHVAAAKTFFNGAALGREIAAAVSAYFLSPKGGISL
jgi:hypothetical protein